MHAQEEHRNILGNSKMLKINVSKLYLDPGLYAKQYLVMNISMLYIMGWNIFVI
jgi:hypothetical protein